MLLEANTITSSAHSRSTKGRTDVVNTKSAEHLSTVLRMISSMTKLNKKGLATVSRLTPVPTSNDKVNPGGVRTAVAVLLFMCSIMIHANELFWDTFGAKHIEKVFLVFRDG
ncbi:hypothetical protein RB195_022981 [Necator americanus]|uniref:Uncharacterized protein n=1 Tax=Necator americanus TaxID=51031 RepID=A0ABR1EHL8_NECAM